MIFNSAIFFPFFALVVFGVLVLRGSWRIHFLTVMSFVFYAEAYPPHLLILLTSCIVDYWVVRGLCKVQRPKLRAVLLAVSIICNLGLLFFFKYSAFLMRGMNDLFGVTGVHLVMPVPSYMLPIGISFYTFETLSYTIDVYKGHCAPAKTFGQYAMFIAFFPHLVAGPILRAADFLPQIDNFQPFQRTNTLRGIELILIGFFKKCVIADNLGPFVNAIYNPDGGSVPYTSIACGGGTVWLGTLFFAGQIYTDFSGYSDIARGIGTMLGFDLPVNFRWPYFSTSITDFWRRWHITLGTWIRDYLYISMGGNQTSPLRWIFNMTIVWFLCGLWHGAAYTFILWGLYNGFLIVVQHFAQKSRLGSLWDALPERPRAAMQIVYTFLTVLVGWTFFRATSLLQAKDYLKAMFGFGPHPFWEGAALFAGLPLVLFACAAALHTLAWRCQWDVDQNSILVRIPYWPRVVFVSSTAAFIVVFAGTASTFIYFAF